MLYNKQALRANFAPLIALMLCLIIFFSLAGRRHTLNSSRPYCLKGFICKAIMLK